MRVLVHIPTGLTTPELEIMLACAQSSIDDGDETIIVSCAGSKGYGCSLNIHGIQATCHTCKAMTVRGIASLEGSYTHLQTPPLQKTAKRNFKDRWGIKAQAVEGIDVGQAAYSSYIAQSRDQDLEGRLASTSLNRLLAVAEQQVAWFRELIRHQEIDKVVLYNGRQSQYRPLLRVAQQESKSVDVMEYAGQEANCVYVFRDQLPQDLEVLRVNIEDRWRRFTGDPERAADSYYSSLRIGRMVNDSKTYVLGQTQGLMPEGWDTNKHNVVVYNHSEDEFAALGGEYDKTLYVNQTEAMHRLCATLADDPNVILWLRIHPNLSKVHWSFAQKLLLLEERFSNVRVIRGDSRVSTYGLLDAANTVVSFGSTIGIEAAYWGKPSILLGRCIYEHFGSVYTPRTHEEAIRLIRARDLTPLPREGAFKIAVFWTSGGISIPHFSGNRRTGFLFRGRVLRKTRIESLIYALAKVIDKIILERLINYGLGATSRWIREYRQHA